MTQREAVIKTLERLGGIATLGTLYQEVFKITECTWKTKTPFASIRQKSIKSNLVFGLWNLIVKNWSQTAFLSRQKRTKILQK